MRTALGMFAGNCTHCTGCVSSEEGEPAPALLAFSLPEAELTAVHLIPENLERCRTPQDWHRLSGVAPGGTSAWLFADPLTMDAGG